MPHTRRSVLFSPGDRPDMMRKAPETGADVLVFDLEDAVAPAGKDDAREAVADALRGTDRSRGRDPEILVRVTPDEWEADLDAVIAGNPRLDGIGIMLPKVASPADVEALAAGLDDRIEGNERSDERERGGERPIVALIESARGVLNAASIARFRAVDALCFGAEDLAADVGAERTPEGTEVLYARQRVVLAAASAGIDAIDTIVTEIGETSRLREETAFARKLGYDGKMAIHPAQVPVINNAFTPDAERVEWAERVLDAREASGKEGGTESESKSGGGGGGVFRVDGEMIDAPLIAQAERIVALARAADEDGDERTDARQDEKGD